MQKAIKYKLQQLIMVEMYKKLNYNLEYLDIAHVHEICYIEIVHEHNKIHVQNKCL